MRPEKRRASRLGSLSRDGETLVYQSRRGEGWEIYSMSLPGRKQTSVCTGAGRAYAQIVNWTGTTIVYLLAREQQLSLWQVTSSGGLPQKLVNWFYPTDWSPDSKFLLENNRMKSSSWISKREPIGPF